MPQRSDGRYIEPMPKLRRGSMRESSGSSSRPSRDRSYSYSGVGPSRYIPIGAPPAPPLLPPYPPPDPYYPLAVPHHQHSRQELSPFAGQPHLSSAPRPYSPGWEQWKSDLRHRFDSAGVNYIVPPAPHPPSQPPPHPPSHPPRHVGIREPSGRATISPDKVVMEMVSFGKWIGSHGKHYSAPGKVTDIARRLAHNLPDFADLFSEVAMRREARSFLRHSTGEDLYQSGLIVLGLFESAMPYIKGPLKRRSECSRSELAYAQNLITRMLVHDYNTWDGLLWHVTAWICTRRLTHS